MSRHPRAGHKAERKERATPTAPESALEQNPLDFALAFMRDDSKPDTLRVSVAKAAMPYLHKRGEEQDDAQDDAPEPKRMSDLELARRIAHILTRGKEQREREEAETAAKRSESEASTAPHSPPADAVQNRFMPSAQVWTDQVSSDDGRAQRNGPPDPHPGYRWIP